MSKSTKSVGIIGLGDMGTMYAKRLSQAGWKVVAADHESRFAEMKEKLADTTVQVVPNGHLVSRRCDYTIYNVEASNIDKVVKMYGPSTKLGACVGGQTSCKAPEIAAFEKYLADDVEIVSIHSMHGPNVDPRDQPLAVIAHRASKETVAFVEEVLECLHSSVIHLSARAHDSITADVQAVTHMAFLSMGTAWKANDQYPWLHSRLSGGMENAKINIALRIYSNSWHVYAGLAITNPMAHIQTLQYATSITDLFKLIVLGRRQELFDRVMVARAYVFNKVIEEPEHSILLPDSVLGQFSLSQDTVPGVHLPNSHLSLLGIVDCWYQSKIIPYDHMICSSPLFRILLGVTEFLFMSPGLLEQCLQDAFSELSYRGDDVEFVVSCRTWAKIVHDQDFEGYKRLFESTANHFEHMFPEATRIGSAMIKAINERRRI